jgi:hypothetical protein
MAIIRTVALGAALIVAAGIGPAYAATINIVHAPTVSIHVPPPTAQNLKVITSGRPHSIPGHTGRAGPPCTRSNPCNCSSGICKHMPFYESSPLAPTQFKFAQ